MKMYANTTSTQREVVATVLMGESLLALIRQCAQDNDVDFLRSLKAAGRFDIEPEDLFQEGHNTHAMMNGRSLPWVDALGAQLLAQAHTPQTWPTGLSARPQVEGLQLNVRQSPEMRTFMHGLVAETLDRIMTLRNGLPALDRILLIRTDATLAVMNSIACATNDVALLKIIQAHGPRKHIDIGELVDPMGMASGDHQDAVRFSPVAFAVRTGSMQVLEHLSATCGDLVTFSLGKCQRQNNKIWKRIDVNDVIDLVGMTPSPSLMRWALRSQQTDPDDPGIVIPCYDGPFAVWLKDVAMPKLTKDWVHLTQVAMDERVFDLDLRNSVLRASVTNHPALMAHLIPGMALPPVESVPDPASPTKPPRTWFVEDHPVRRLLRPSNGHKAAQWPDVDATLRVVLSELQDRSLLTDVFSARDKDGLSVAMRCVQFNLPGSFAFLSAHGLDLDERSPTGQTFEEKANSVEADPGSHDGLIRIVRSARAHRAATAALIEFLPELKDDASFSVAPDVFAPMAGASGCAP